MAKKILRDEWTNYYKPTENTPETTASSQASSNSQLDNDEDMFAKLDTQYAAMATTELETYIQDDPIISEFTADPVKHWDAKSRDPFARMTLDFVSAPGEFS